MSLEPGRSPLHPSLVRPALVAGVERRIVILEATLALTLLLGVGLSVFTVATTLVLVFGVHPLLARVSKADPHALAVYARSVQKQDLYPRAAHPAAPAHLHLPFTDL